MWATARRPETLADLAAKGAHVTALDVTDEASMSAAVAEVEAAHGAVGTLVNNAGYGEYGAVEEVAMDKVRAMFETNVFGLARMCQLVLPGMRAAGRGRIVNLSSMGGRMTFPLGGYYHATKYAVEALSDALRVEVKPFGVQVVVIEPGVTRSGFEETISASDALASHDDSPYAAMRASVAEGNSAAYTNPRLSASAESVAQTLVKAVEADRPRTRYLLTPAARAMVTARAVGRRPGLGRHREAPVQPLMVALLEPLEAPVHPIEALRRVAFLLERTRAGTYRVEAFRNAVKTLKPLDAAELRERAEAGTLQEIPGIGKSTSGVIAEALAGELPAYLASLQEKSGGPLVDGGEQMYAALRGDCHLHSDWSDGGSPIDEMVLTGIELGHEWLVLTDHSPQLRVANGLTVERLTQQIGIVEAIDRSLGGSFRLLKGIEVDILDDGGLDQTDAMLARLDLVTASVHSKLRMNGGPMTTRMVNAVSNPRVNVLGHCTGRLVEGSRGTRPQSDFDARAVFEACAEHDTAVEINSRPERCDPPDELVLLALEIGCLFSIDSDAHAPGQLDMKAYGCERAERLGVPADRIVTTWDADRLLAWANPGR